MTTAGLRNGRRWTETCSVDGCGSPFYCKGLCGKHYARLRRYGDPSVYWPTKRTGCSSWTGTEFDVVVTK